MSSAPSTQREAGRRRGRFGSVHLPVFIPAVTLIVAFVLFAMIMPGLAQDVLVTAQEEIIPVFGWYYVAIVSAFVIFVVIVGISRLGDVKLGPDDAKPEFSLLSWLAMLFAAGMGIGLVFFGVSEPLSHLAEPKPGTGGSATELAQAGLVQTLLHWGLHTWSIYVVVGLAVAYAVHRKGRPVSIRWALEPLLGDRVRGRIGDVIDVTAVVGTMFGVATSLGLGVLQISSGLSFLGVGAAAGAPGIFHVLLIALITGIATISVVTGLSKGIKWLSNFNMSLAGLVMAFVLVTGPTLFILREFIQAVGLYLQNLPELSFDATALERGTGAEWQAQWTTFYWGWWISWAPFVGVFIARISRGRTVREFIGGVLLVPTVLSMLWFSVFGGTGLYRELFGAGGLIQDGTVDTEGALFSVLDGLPAGTIVVAATVVLIATFFITSSDSGSLVIDMLSSGGNPDPPTWSRIMWAVLEGAVAAALLIAGGQAALTALETVAALTALPFSVVMIAMCVATWRQLRAEHEALGRIARRRRTDELTAHVQQTLDNNDRTGGNQ